MQVLLAGASARLAWETDEEWAFREWAISKSRNITRPCVRPFTCESPGGPSCALAAPCLEGDGRGAYARSVEFWRAATSKARWEELVALRPYHVHPQLDERAIDCPLRPQRKLPYLILDGDQLGPTRKAPGELVRELDSAGLDRVVLLGDSLMRYIFASIVGTYCDVGDGDDFVPAAGCELSLKNRGAMVVRATGGGRNATVAYVDGVHLHLHNLKRHPAFGVGDGGDPRRTHLIYRSIAHSNEAAMPQLDVTARSAHTRRLVADFFRRAAVAGILRGSIVSPTPVSYVGAVEYNPLGDRNDGPRRAVDVHAMACGLGLPVVDLWPLEMTCASQGRAPNHGNVHYCLPGVPDVEWQLLVRFLVATRHDHEGIGAKDCTCPNVDLLTCGNDLRACAVDAEAEREARRAVVNAGTSRQYYGFERRSRAMLAALCSNSTDDRHDTSLCPNFMTALADPHLVKSDDSHQRSCIDVCV